MRSKLLLIFLVVAVTLGLIFVWTNRQPNNQRGAILLSNVPDHFCPTKAQVVVTPAASGSIEFDKLVAVTDCRTIDLANVLGDSKLARNLFIKLSGALAAKIHVDSPTDSYSFAPILGDANNDNIIDQIDQNLVEKALLAGSSTPFSGADIDQDKVVTVLDLSLTKINARVGVGRPDKKSWSQP